ncbi:MAG: M6 family metalloprotease domain-containing protein [Tidjanibacter sp.]|nr:M6 family metalloprotease domain-containing protein [Tidjanibacter sp.]
MKRLLTLLVIASFGITQLAAIPAKRGNIVHTQSDGTRLTLQIFGDEYNHYTATTDGYTVVLGDDGDYCYAASLDGRLVASEVKVSNRLSDVDRQVAQKSRGIRPAKLSNIARTAATESGVLLAPSRAAQTFGIWGGEVKGTLKGLVILVNFSDKKFTTSSPKEAFSKMLNTAGYSDNGGTGSARDYFVDNSSGQFSPTFDVYGPYTLPKTSKYYAGTEGTDNGEEMIADACKAADADIDFSQYAENGKVRSVFVYFAGYNQAESGNTSQVWPHQYSVFSPQTTLDGVRIYDYACTSELRGSSGSTMAGIGTFCHEFGHVLGLPDFYDTDTANGDAFGLDITSVMDYGSYLNDGCTPPAYNILERWMLGWGSPTDIVSSGTYTLKPVYDNVGYRIETPTNYDYYLFENRSKAAGNKWDYYLLNGDGSICGGGGGMLVYHIDYTSSYRSRWSENKINAYSAHECVKLMRAVPNAVVTSAQLSNSKKWYFPGSANVTSITDVTSPALKSWSGVAPDCLVVSITESGEDIILKTSTVKEITSLKADALQYDALLTWDSSVAGVSFVVECLDENNNSILKQTTSDLFLPLSPLEAGKSYTATVRQSTSDTKYSIGFTTDSANTRSRTRMKVAYQQSPGGYIRLSVANLHTAPTDIVWYVDSVKSSSYVKLAVGEHTISAVATSATNTEYLYRYINVTE